MKNVFTNKLVWMNHLHIFIYSVNVSTGTGVHLARLSHSDLLTYSPALCLSKTPPFISGEGQQHPYSTKWKHRGVWWKSELIRDKCKLRSLNPVVIRLRLSVETAVAEKFSMIPQAWVTCISWFPWYPVPREHSIIIKGYLNFQIVSPLKVRIFSY